MMDRREAPLVTLLLLSTLCLCSSKDGVGRMGHTVCRPPNATEGGCSVDGADCAGEQVTLNPLTLDVRTWDHATSTSALVGNVTSYFINGGMNTWQMYLHGPAFHTEARPTPDSIPPVYVFGTFTNQIYRFDNFSLPAQTDVKHPKPITATQKLVGKALAPSTGFIIDDKKNHKINGLLVAEGQPFWVSNMTGHVQELYKGGVEYLHTGHKDNCTTVFPIDPIKKATGQVVNTVDCHLPTETCFFSVWKFYDDTPGIWNPATTKMADDCLYYCVMQTGSLTDPLVEPVCKKHGIMEDLNGQPICHKHGIGAVHGLKIGNTDATDQTKFDLLLVFTGVMLMTNGESSMRKLSVQVVPDGGDTHGQVKVLTSNPYAVDLFTKYAGHGFDVGGDHAWVDDTGKYVWVSCFREKGLGLHMLEYETGALVHSITGIDRFVKDQYTYTSGIHGTGTLGKPGSYIAVATSSCHDLSVCIPTVPWVWPIPKKLWSIAPFIIIDLSSVYMEPHAPPTIKA